MPGPSFFVPGPSGFVDAMLGNNYNHPKEWMIRNYLGLSSPFIVYYFDVKWRRNVRINHYSTR
jgi:hypothetical protein